MRRRDFITGAGATALVSTLPMRTAAADGLPQSAPVFVSSVGLRTRDAEALARWYRQAVGLRELDRDGTTIWLGAGNTPLLALTEQSALTLADHREAGLFHTAFLLPSRRDLAHWIGMAVQRQVPVAGTADHRVSEAIYLTDPEGNGVEIYADRPQQSWQWSGGEVQMGTFPLDVDGIMSTLGQVPPDWQGAPDGTSVGHVHLKVGDATRAGQWWQDVMGFDAVSTRDDAVFLSTGGYHHHIAVNEWLSAGAARRTEGSTGLAFVHLHHRDRSETRLFEDDWGTQIRLT